MDITRKTSIKNISLNTKNTIYKTNLNKDRNFLLLIHLDIGPFRNLDFGSCFFLIKKPEFPTMNILDPSIYEFGRLDLTISDLTMSPFRLNLYLNPLYSILGGSTTLEDPLAKNPILVLFL
jgi:hypothetical protein